jgi:hypothetical protein
MSVNDYDSDRPISPRLPRQWSWIALVVIIALGAVGFFRGLGGGRPLASLLAPVKGLPVVAALTAADAAPLPHNDDWSVLSGPKVLPPPAPKPVRAESDDDADQSDAAPDQPAAAQVDAQAPDDTPTPGAQPDAPPPTTPPPQ